MGGAVCGGSLRSPVAAAAVGASNAFDRPTLVEQRGERPAGGPIADAEKGVASAGPMLSLLSRYVVRTGRDRGQMDP